MSHASNPEHIDFEISLTHEEGRRRAAVVEAMGDGWDPIAVLEGEQEAERRLYSGLDADQRRIYDELVSAGVLPPGIGGGHAAA
ncbi:DUF6400 family protein [Streptomyces sp. NPDC051907]|uniref:DUF6400 family protein n=1 Tax=Streptomyces sp. NPDC051907 TaxID=3155284 RepID=UPI00342608F6